MTSYLDVARAVIARAGGDPDTAGPLAEWAERTQPEADTRTGVIIGRDGTILAETTRQGRGGAVTAFYVTTDHVGIDGLGIERLEVGLAMGQLRRVTGQDVLHVRGWDLRPVGRPSAASRLRAEQREAALARLTAYREACERRDTDVKAAALAGASQAEIIRASGLARATVRSIIDSSNG